MVPFFVEIIAVGSGDKFDLRMTFLRKARAQGNVIQPIGIKNSLGRIHSLILDELLDPNSA
jgi:hypothetical protein